MKQIIRYFVKQRALFLRKSNGLRFFSTINELNPDLELRERQLGLHLPREKALVEARKGLLCEVLQCNEDIAKKMIDRNIYFLVKREVNIRKKAIFARQHFTLEDIVDHSELLTLSKGPIQEHFLNMSDFGFKNITCSTLLAYEKLFRKPATELIEMEHMDAACDPVESVLSILSCPEFTRQMKQEFTFKQYMATPVITLHRTLLPRYLAHRLRSSIAHARFLVDLHHDFAGRSFTHIKECFSIVQDVLKFPIEKIRVNPYLLHQDPSNLHSILSLPSLMGGETLEMASKFPKVISMPVENILRVETILREYGVTDDVLRTCRYLFLLNPETVENLIIKRKLKQMIGR